jgi:UDPglucose 6-dehydrogenase
VDPEKIAKLAKGESPIYERGLEDLLDRNLKEGRLRFTTQLDEAVPQSEVVFIAVGTPPGPDGAADLTNIYEVARKIACLIQPNVIIVMKSTVPVGTTEQIRDLIKAETTAPFEIAMNPEFMKEGAAVDDFMKPDRVVLGVESERAGRIMKELYEPFVRTEKPILAMSLRSAEMTKYAANAMLATKISYINEIANLCEKLGADVNDVRRGIGFDSRIGFQFLFPGIGYGGSCFPKDIDALVRTARDSGYEPRVLAAVQAVNQGQRRWMIEKVLGHFAGKFEDPIAVWGLAFKPQTDDVRESPGVEIVQGLLKAGAVIRAYDPVATKNAESVFGDRVLFCETAYEALGGAAGLVINTEWNEFRRPSFDKMKRLMKKPVIFDGRNLYDPQTMTEQGFTYYSVGRKTVGN